MHTPYDDSLFTTGWKYCSLQNQEEGKDLKSPPPPPPIFTYLIFSCDIQTPLKKLMEAYCQRQSLQLDQIRFLFDGQRFDRPAAYFFTNVLYVLE